MNSVISFPNRGNQWGDNSWRGNMSGHVMVELINQYKPGYVVDCCEGSGTSKDVCRDMGIEYTGLDLMYGNDYTRDSIAEQLVRPADLAFSHPAYHTMIDYLAERKKHNKDMTDVAGDHSSCPTVEEFLYKSQVMLLNQRESVKSGGMYATLIGDMRKKGAFHSFQADFIKMMPGAELKSVVIKAQHNTMSGNRSYNNFKHPAISHEYLLIWEKSAKTVYQVVWDKALELKKEIASTWRSLIRIVMMRLKEASLKEIYLEVEKNAGSLIEKNQHWKAKIRQQLQKYHNQVERGVWAV